MGLEVRRTSGENEVLPENLKASLEIERTAPFPDGTVQSVIGGFIFSKPSHSSYFPYSRVVLVGIGLIKGFP